MCIRLIVLVAIIATSCKPFKMVEYKNLDYINVNKIENGQANVNVGIQLFNPNNYAIIIKGANLKASINQVALADISNNAKFKLPANNTNTQPLALSISNSQLTSLIPILMMRGKLKLTVTGYVKGRVGIFGRKIPVQHEEDIHMKDLSGLGF